MWANTGDREADEEANECTQQRAEVLQGMQKDHKYEHEDSHIISGKRYKCTIKLPDEMICRCHYKAQGSLCIHITNAHHKKLSEAGYLKNEDVTWETLDQFRA